MNLWTYGTFVIISVTRVAGVAANLAIVTTGQLTQPTNVRLIRYLTGGVEIQWDDEPNLRNVTGKW